MVQRKARSNDDEPEQKKFEMPSAKEHLFQVVDVIDDISDDPDIVHAKLEVCGGDEEGRTMLNRLSLDDEYAGFFATRLFLKSIGEPYKGTEFPIDSDNWIGRQMHATVVHNKAPNGKTYANISEYNFEKIVEQGTPPTASNPDQAINTDEIAWDDDK